MKTPFLIALLCLPAFVGALFAQSSPPSSQPFGLKGDVLGETLQEFRARNDRIIHSRSDAINGRGTKHLPQCTGDKTGGDTDFLSTDVLRETDEERAGIVKCIASLGVRDEPWAFSDQPTVAGVGAERTIYYFFGGRLYMIRSELGDYRPLRGAFISKYGPPAISIAHYQNSFGAKVIGERLRWENSTSRITIGERDADGDVLLIMWHKVLGQEVEAAGAVKDRAKDL